MKKSILLSLLASSLLAAGGDIAPATPVATTPVPTEFGLLDNLVYNGQLLTRYENADDSVNEEANAFTTRFALSAGAGLAGIEGLSVFGQIIAVTNFGYDEYAPEQAGYALIADPQNSRITQAYLDYKIGKTAARIGRQMMNIDDERFVGAVGWRQMPQTFMAYTLTNTSIEKATLMASYITNRYGVMDTLSGNTETAVLHADYQAMPELKLTGYGYLIGSSGNTYGAMATGKVSFLNYIAEAATQQDATLANENAGKPSVDAMYYRGDLSTVYNGIVLGVAYESLGSADGNSHGFTTPFATLHKWQGFADAFLGYTATSNAFGLNDAYAKIGYVGSTYGKVFGFYHDFSAQDTTGTNTEDAGSEIDLLYTYDFSKKLGFLAKAAFFTGESNSVIGAARNDLDRYWVQLDYKF
ncbi:MAG TPA: hypothetical protein PLH07_05755 [Sulfurovum sp.]|jgi:hypothetical protein|nr:MAG: hypothetical protein B7Y63_05865 [Sulfurovum sp. 35-42-20]OYZ25575.1 MAG: hypothetical protein B7Y23_04865 [Sulfurovum sp. 16-42-52]OYZ49586.1 MAG: hypothetical protein B7Y13_04020 [Sulfurovum sp. 24-42-9]OZA45563.1 MAG: hypothetical protein B7X80_04725 [Sulfurovum sp. 17-42-90]OZA59605.1 MAG: hypothetical protein B7X69_07420 [Sulfurovum sp. 39-42-12]HQR74661.1 hypothetical protein [Sulfurovum sp.]